jgi:hypothetical protein
MSGTSMAAPHVTGTVALMFEAAPRRLRIEETHNLLLASAERVSIPEEFPDRVGIGYLDIEEAVKGARKLGSVSPILKQINAPKAAAAQTEAQEQAVNAYEAAPGEGKDDGQCSCQHSVDASSAMASEMQSSEATGSAALSEQIGTEKEGGDVSSSELRWEAAEGPALANEAGLVEMADQIVVEQTTGRFAGPILHEMLSRGGLAEALTIPASGCLPTAAEIFDAFAYPEREALRGRLEEHFEVVALPRASVGQDLREGDILVRRAEGGLAHLSVIASADLRDVETLMVDGLTPENFASGQYAQVVETGVRPHGRADDFARRVADRTGRLPYDQLVLRPREGLGQGVMREIGESTTAPKLAESFSGQVYTQGWTTFAPFELNGKPHYIAYKALSRDVSVDRFRSGLHEDPATHWPVDVRYSNTWTADWTTLFTFKMDGKPHYFVYNKDSGWVAIGRLDASGSGVTEKTLFDAQVFSTGWTHFMPFELNGRPHYLAYKATPDADGKCQVTIDRIRPGAKANAKGWPVDTLWGTYLDPTEKWTPGWTHFMPFTLPGRSEVHYLSYKALTGDIDIDRIRPDGKGFQTIWGTFLDPTIIWSHGPNAWTHFIPFTINGLAHYLSYKAKTGEVAIDRIKVDGMGSDTIWGTPLDSKFKWWPGWTTIMPFKMDAKPHYFAYNAANGWVAAASMAEELRSCVSPGVSSDDPTALSISNVGRNDFNVSLTVRGMARNVRANVFYPAKTSGSGQPFNVSAVPGGRAPIVFIAHGNHPIFFNPANRQDERGFDPGGFDRLPNHAGYTYFQELLARMGIISVSVDCNEFSGPVSLTPGNINLRADLVLGAIKHMQSLGSGSDPVFGGHVDFSNVGLMGHSRGGEVVLLVPELLAQPATGIGGVTVKAVLAIAPTDIGATSGAPAGYALMTVLPAADLDVRFNSGARFYDRASADPFKCQLYIHNANHNFFNTQWVSDDLSRWDPAVSSLRIPRSTITVMSKDEQKAILKAYGCAFFRTVLLGHSLRMFLENLELPPGVDRFRDVHISFERTNSVTVEDNEGPDLNINTLGKPNQRLGGLTARKCALIKGSVSACNNTFYGNTRGMVASSSAATGGFRWELAGTTDLSGSEIRIRTAEVYNGSSVPAGATGFKLGLEDAKGRVAFVDSDAVAGLPHPYDRRADDMALFGDDFTKTMLKTLRFPTSCISRAKKEFDVTQVRAICLRMDRNDGRTLAFDQLQIVS